MWHGGEIKWGPLHHCQSSIHMNVWDFKFGLVR